MKPECEFASAAAYVAPALERFGTLRELTQQGNTGAADGAAILGISGCVVNGRTDTCPTAS